MNHRFHHKENYILESMDHLEGDSYTEDNINHCSHYRDSYKQDSMDHHSHDIERYIQNSMDYSSHDRYSYIQDSMDHHSHDRQSLIQDRMDHRFHNKDIHRTVWTIVPTIKIYTGQESYRQERINHQFPWQRKLYARQYVSTFI